MKYLFVFLTFIFCTHIYAHQPSSVNGLIITQTSEGVSFVSLMLISVTDNTIIKLNISDEDGVFCIPKLPPGAYFLKIKHPVYETYSTEVFKLETDKEWMLPVIILKEKEQKLLPKIDSFPFMMEDFFR